MSTNFTKLSDVILESSKGKYFIECPGCKMLHSINVGEQHQIRWDFNNDFEKPTFRPSLLVTLNSSLICHSFITEGKIQFLGDCFHELANKTVDLPQVEDFWWQ